MATFINLPHSFRRWTNGLSQARGLLHMPSTFFRLMAESPSLATRSQHPYFGFSGLWQSRISDPYRVAQGAPAPCVHLQPCCFPSPNFWILSLEIRSCTALNPGDPPLTSLALISLMAISSGSMVVTYLMIVFILSADAKNLPLCRERANSTTVGRGSRHPGSPTACIFPDAIF